MQYSLCTVYCTKKKPYLRQIKNLYAHSTISCIFENLHLLHTYCNILHILTTSNYGISFLLENKNRKLLEKYLELQNMIYFLKAKVVKYNLVVVAMFFTSHDICASVYQANFFRKKYSLMSYGAHEILPTFLVIY